MKKIILIATTIIVSQTTFAQWNRAIGIDDRFVYSIRKIDNYLFAATDSGAYRSVDGINWQMKIFGMDITELNTRDFYKNGVNLYAASMAGLYVSTDYGDNWQLTNYPHPNNPAISIYAINNIILASTTGGGIYRSSDNGITWEAGSGDNFWKYAMINGKLFASTYQDVSVSLDTGLTWQSTNFNDFAYDLLNVNDTLLVTTFSNGIAQTPANSTNWTYLNALQINSSFEFATKADTIFVSSSNSIYYFKNRNQPAHMVSLNGLNVFPDNQLNSIEIFNNLLVVGTENQNTLLGKGIWYYPLNLLTGIQNNTTESKISVFPNPTSALINLRLIDNNITQIDIVNIYGQKVISIKNITQTLTIDISSLSNGIYFIKATSKNGSIYLTEKIIKN